MAQPVYPPAEALTSTEQAINLIFTALQLLDPATAPGNVAALGGVIESLQGLVTSWMVSGIA